MKLGDWFSKNETFGLILPDGWFGRPYDNVHQKTWFVDRKYKLIIEIDEHLYLIITKSSQLIIEEDKNDLVIRNFGNLVFDRLGYGDLKPSTDIYSTGELRFVSYKNLS